MTVSKTQGFTLVELIITIAILAIVLAIVAPNLMQFVNQTRLKGVAENMAQDLVMARTEASRLNRKLRLDLRSTCYGITKNIISGCNCSVTDSAATNYCEIKREGQWRNTTLSASSDFNDLVFDHIRGAPANLTNTQTVDISNSAGTITLSMTVIGGVCLSSSGATKIAGYNDAC